MFLGAERYALGERVLADETAGNLAAGQPSAAARAKHIIDVLIEERAPHLASHWSWPAARPLLNTVLGYDRAIEMANAIAPLSGEEALLYVSRLLQLKVEIQGAENLPKTGRCVVVSNHPTGIADGMALFEALRPLRPDVCFFANADAHRVCPGFHENLIPVEWVYEKRTPAKTRETLRAAVKALKDERPLVLFPAGRLARKRNGRLIDPEWSNTCASLARKHDAPIVPVHMAGPWSFWFHFFDGVSGELRDITLFHEFLNKAGREFRLIIGPQIPSEAMDGDATQRTADVKFYVENVLPHGPKTNFAR